MSDTALEVNSPRNEDKGMDKKYIRGYLIYTSPESHAKKYVWNNYNFCLEPP
jgi:hypothetical protein